MSRSTSSLDKWNGLTARVIFVLPDEAAPRAIESGGFNRWKRPADEAVIISMRFFRRLLVGD